MTDLDKALAAARESLANEGHRSADALRDLLAALDAARGQAVGYVFPGDAERAKLDDAWFPIQPTKRDDYHEPVFYAPPAALAVPAGWRVFWFTGSFKRGSERWEIYDPEGNGGAVDKSDIRDDMVWGLLDALATTNKENNHD